MNRNNIYSFCGRNSGLYRAGSFITFLGREKKLRKKAIIKLDLKKGDTVLDLCCGTGLNFPYLLEEIGPEGRIVGFDYSKEMLSAAKKSIEKNKWQNIELIHGNAEELPLPKESFNGVFSSLGISTVQNQEKALDRAKDVLKENKKIVILDAESFSGIWKILNILIKPAYKKLADWDYKKNVTQSFAEIFPKFEAEEFNLGTIYILSGQKN